MIELPSAPQTYEAALCLAIAKYLDRILLQTSEPTKTLWDTQIQAPEEFTSKFTYSGWISTPRLASPTENDNLDRNSIELYIEFRIGNEKASNLRTEAVDRVRQLQQALEALAKDPEGITGYSLEGTYHGEFFPRNHLLSITPADSAWTITTVPSPSTSACQSGAIAIISRNWLVRTTKRL